MKYGCIGEKLAHSFSGTIHRMIADYPYELCELSRDELGAFMQKRDFLALNVTIPYKESVIPYLDGISEAAKEVVAVNTVVNRDGELFGYNTDVVGLTRLIKKSGIQICGKTVLILGTGGTSRTAYAVAKELGAKNIYKAGRSAKDGAISYDAAYSMADTVDVIINTTPCGMYPNIQNKAIDLAPFSGLSGVIDVVYNPLKTELLLQAEKLNIPCAGGLYMLVSQAVAASEIFTESHYKENLADDIYAEILKEKRNIVLIGMPSSGKSTVGRILAKKLSKSFYDTDDETEKMTGKSPKELIEAYGEPQFRKAESEAILSLCTKTGAVIATGGGAVCTEENIKNLKRNGIIVFLDMKEKDLAASKDRPLSDSAEKLAALYKERLPEYIAAADIRTDASRDAELTAERVIKAL